VKQEDKIKRKESIVATREKRKSQSCKVYSLKVDSSHLSKEKKEYFKRIFLEGKWYYNYILSSEYIFEFDEKQTIITILNKDKQLEEREKRKHNSVFDKMVRWVRGY
jgi:putative transposase